MNDLSLPLIETEPRLALATLQAELDALGEEARRFREGLSRTDKQRARLQSEIKQIEERLAASRDNITVSDHAVIRYLERRYGFDFEKIRDEILSPAVRNAVNAGAKGIKIDGATFKIQERTITTYVVNKSEREP